MTIITTIDLTTLGKKELRGLAREFSVTGFSKMHKEELLTALTQVQDNYRRAEASCEGAEKEARTFGTSFTDQVTYEVNGKKYGVWKDRVERTICAYDIEAETTAILEANWTISSAKAIIKAIEDTFSAPAIEPELKEYLEKKNYGGWDSLKVLFDDGKTIKMELDFGDDEVVGIRVTRRKGDNGSYRITQTW